MSVGAAVACCALAAACTSESAPSSAPSSSPAATAPTESQIERQIRLDYEAAEEAYRVSVAEQDRLYQAGGSEKTTPELKATATGSYLRITLDSLARSESRLACKRQDQDRRCFSRWRLENQPRRRDQLRGQRSLQFVDRTGRELPQRSSGVMCRH